MRNTALKTEDESESYKQYSMYLDTLGEERSEPHLQAISEYIHYSNVVQTVIWRQAFKAM